MPNAAFETVEAPLTTFRFEVVLTLDDPPPGVTDPVCNAAFSECSGLEMGIDAWTIRQGGDNRRQIHRPGPATYGTLTLRRGMTANLHLWTWMAATLTPGRNNKAQGEVTMWGTDGTPQLTFVLEDCLPTRMRGPSLNANGGLVGIEEMTLAYGALSLRPAGQAGAGAGLSLGLSGGINAGVSAGVSVSGGPGLSAGVSASASASFSIG